MGVALAARPPSDASQDEQWRYRRLRSETPCAEEATRAAEEAPRPARSSMIGVDYDRNIVSNVLLRCLHIVLIVTLRHSKLRRM